MLLEQNSDSFYRDFGLGIGLGVKRELILGTTNTLGLGLWVVLAS